jgi:hypothetical protein
MKTNIINKGRKPIKRREYIALTDVEQQLLSSLVIGYGNMAACMEFTQKDSGLIRRAAKGFRLRPDNAKKIREYLSYNRQSLERVMS